MISEPITPFYNECFISCIILIISDCFNLIKVIESASLEILYKMKYILLFAVVGKFIITVLDKIMTIYYALLLYRTMST